MKELFVQKAIKKAKIHMERGEIKQVCELYNAILWRSKYSASDEIIALHPDNPDENKVILSSEVVDRLIELLNKGDAEIVLHETITLTRKYPETPILLNLIGASAGQVGCYELAVSAFKKVINIQPNYAEAHNNLGVVLKEWGYLQQAIASFQKAIEINSQYFEAHNNLGITLKEHGDLDQAIASYRKAIEINMHYAEAYNNLGAALSENDKNEEALVFLQKALSISPNYAKVHHNLGVALLGLDKFSEAANAFKTVISIDVDFVEAYYNLGVSQTGLGELHEAKHAYRKAIHLDPSHFKALHNLGRLNWLQNNFESAFELMEWRWQGEPECIGTQFDGNRPTWDGDASEAVFVWREQGIGDEIMFGSMLPALHAISSKVILECDQRLIPIYERSFPEGIRFVSHRNQVSEDEYTSHIAVGSLLKHFRRKLEDFSSVSPGWLKAEPKKIASLRERLRSKASDKVIGISWQTNATGTKSYQRNIPLDILAKYLKPVQAKFVNLQYDSTTDVLLNAEKSTGLKIDNIDEIDIYNDIDGLAALISACDIVVSIDNSTVHLAGALGIDTRVLLPEVADERWGLDSSDSYWYDHLTLYRQISKDDWSNPLECLVQDLKFTDNL